MTAEPLSTRARAVAERLRRFADHVSKYGLPGPAFADLYGDDIRATADLAEIVAGIVEQMEKAK